METLIHDSGPSGSTDLQHRQRGTDWLHVEWGTGRGGSRWTGVMSWRKVGTRSGKMTRICLSGSVGGAVFGRLKAEATAGDVVAIFAQEFP